jgi:predicted permease
MTKALLVAFARRLPRPVTIRSFLSADLRDALRSLWSTPLVTAAAVLSLALGAGANTALFSILNSLVMRQLPVHEPQRLAMVGRTSWTNPIWEQIRDRQEVLFEDACAWSAESFNLASSGVVDQVEGAYVSGSLFRTLGIDTIAGRPLTASDDVRGGGANGHVAVISYRFWQQRFGGMQDVLGRRLFVDRVPFTIVGVTPRGFRGPEVGRAMDVFLPLAAEAAIRGRESALDGRSSWWLQLMIRLKPNQTLDEGTAALNAVRQAVREATMPPTYTAEYRATYLDDDDDFRLVAAAEGISTLRDRFEQPLTIIIIVAGAVLLIACTNIANLMLARAASRRHEMSVRLALGASRARLACQVFAEGLLLAIGGAAAGLAMVRLGAALLIHQLGSAAGPVTLDVPIDWRVLGFTALLAIGATLLFGLAPVIGLGTVEPNDALKEQNRTVTGDGRLGLRHGLVVAQVALSFVLVAGAGLFVRTFTTLATAPLGFNPARLLIVNVDAGRSTAALEDKAAFGQRLADAAATVPGISRASLSYLTPLSGRNWTYRVQVEGGATLPRAEQTAWVNAVAAGWFETYGMRLIAGRDFSASDTMGTERVAIVNEAFVRRFVGPHTPLGQRVKSVGLGRLNQTLIIGVVNDAIYRTARVGIVPTLYLPMTQADVFGLEFALTARVNGGRASVEGSLTEALSRADPNLSFSFRGYEEQLRATLVQERLVAMLSGFFGVLAMLLAALGLYGVTSHAVSRRRPELAVRMALGASGARVMRLVLRRVSALLVAGIAIGAGLSLWAGKFVSALLFGVDAGDPLTLAGAAAVLVAAGLLAGWLPARAASRMDPMTTLRG